MKTTDECPVLTHAPALLETIDQVCAALETCMAHYGDHMCEADRQRRGPRLATISRTVDPRPVETRRPCRPPQTGNENLIHPQPAPADETR
jgi:hypothetical protein